MADTPRERFQDLLESFSTAMLVTQQPDGSLRARPMRIAQVESDADVWFATRLVSGKTDDISKDSQVALSLQGGGKYLSVHGTASISRDKEKIEELWNESMKVWFPGGKDDPELALIHVQATHGEYWDNSWLQGLSYAISAGQAYWNGETPEVSEDVNSKVAL